MIHRHTCGDLLREINTVNGLRLACDKCWVILDDKLGGQ